MFEVLRKVNACLDSVLMSLQEVELFISKGDLEPVKALLDNTQDLIEKILSHSKDERAYILADDNTRNKFSYVIELQAKVLNGCRSAFEEPKLLTRLKLSSDLKSLKAYRDSFLEDAKKCFKA